MELFSVLSEKFAEIRRELALTVSHLDVSGFLSILLLTAGLIAAYIVLVLVIFILCARINALAPIKKNLRKLVFYFLFFIFWKHIPGEASRVFSHIALFVFFFKFIKVADFIMIDLYYSRYAKKEVVHIFRDMVKGGLWAIMILMMLKSIFGFSLKDIAITSAVATAAIGFAFQDTLINLIAGISIVLEKNFKVGDAVQLKSGEIGQVLQTNWRTTRIRNRRNQVIMVPNKELASGEVINYSYYTQIARIFSVGVSYHNSPAYVKTAILDYLKSFPEVLQFPAPEVFAREYRDFYLEYEIRFFTDDFARSLQIEDKVKTGIWYLFKRKGIEIPLPVRHVVIKDREESGYEKPEELIFMPGDNIFEAVKKNRVIQILKGELKLINEKSREALKLFSADSIIFISEALYETARDFYSLSPEKEAVLKVSHPESLPGEFHEKILSLESELRNFLMADRHRHQVPDLKKEENFIQHFLNINFNKDKKNEKD